MFVSSILNDRREAAQFRRDASKFPSNATTVLSSLGLGSAMESSRNSTLAVSWFSRRDVRALERQFSETSLFLSQPRLMQRCSAVQVYRDQIRTPASTYCATRKLYAAAARYTKFGHCSLSTCSPELRLYTLTYKLSEGLI